MFKILILQLLLFEYFILAFLSYFLYKKLNLKFIQKNNDKEFEPTEFMQKIILIKMSIFWIIELPRLCINSIIENNERK